MNLHVRADRPVELSTSIAIEIVTAVGAMVLVVAARQSLGVAPIIGLAVPGADALGALSLVATAIVLAAAVRLPSRIPEPVRRGAVRGTYLAALLLVALGAMGLLGGGGDARILYDHPLPDPYGTAYSDLGFAYSPPFACLLYPFTLLPWGLFLGLWTGLLICALAWMAGPAAPLLMLAPLVALDVNYANINLLLALAMAVGLFRPGAWSLVLLTKVTPAVGLVWFAVRRDWPALMVALLVTGSFVVVTGLVAPGLWADWAALLTGAASDPSVPSAGPLWMRVALAAILVGWGGITDRPWTVAVGGLLAVPVPWPATVTILVALVPLTRRSAGPTAARRAVDRAIGRPVARAAPTSDPSRPSTNQRGT
jgi:hypothetical protein